MIFTFILIDKPGAAELRLQVRPAHKVYLEAVEDRIAFAGPLTHDDGSTMLGSLLAIEFESREAAHAWLSNEPFVLSGLYASTTVHAFVNRWPQKAGFPATH
ncbi:MAG TPA: YciI family protein [Acidovorax sp.]|nr:YciI family protein [Acidovorax sp.]